MSSAYRVLVGMVIGYLRVHVLLCVVLESYSFSVVGGNKNFLCFLFVCTTIQHLKKKL